MREEGEIGCIGILPHIQSIPRSSPTALWDRSTSREKIQALKGPMAWLRSPGTAVAISIRIVAPFWATLPSTSLLHTT